MARTRALFLFRLEFEGVLSSVMGLNCKELFGLLCVGLSDATGGVNEEFNRYMIIWAI